MSHVKSMLWDFSSLVRPDSTPDSTMDKVSLGTIAHLREVEAPESDVEIWDITTDSLPNF
jgi:hypothetical protein